MLLWMRSLARLRAPSAQLYKYITSLSWVRNTSLLLAYEWNIRAKTLCARYRNALHRRFPRRTT